MPNTVDTGSSWVNIAIYLMTLTGTFLVENWYIVGMFIFGLIHAMIAIRKNQREEELHALKVRALEGGVNVSQ